MKIPLSTLSLLLALTAGALAEAPVTTTSLTAEEAAHQSGIHTIYFALMNHQNLSYNSPQDENEVAYKTVIDDVIRYCDESPDFFWTCEGVWMVEKWIEQTPEPEKVEHFMDLVRKGRIEVAAGYSTIPTGTYGSEQTRRITLPGLQLRERYKIPIDTLINNEIAGYTQMLPQVCEQSGVRYFYSAMGWGILGGGTTIPLGHMPFQWEGTGGARVLTWVQRESYAENFFFPHFARFFKSPDIEPGETDDQYMDKMIARRLVGYMNEGYKLDAILTSTGNDNMAAGSIHGFLPKIREWNARHKVPKIVFATPRIFFREMEKRHGKDFPVYAGDWSCAWIGSDAAARWTRNNLLTAESLGQINVTLGGRRSLHEDFGDIYRSAWQACGSHFGGVDEQHPFSHLARRNFIGPEHMRDAMSETAMILHRGMDNLADKIAVTTESVMVFNPVSWERTDPVTVSVYPRQLARGFSLRDPATSVPVEVEILEGQPSFAFVAAKLPPMGYKVFAIDRDERSSRTMVAKSDSGSEIENAFYKVRIDPERGTLASVVEKDTGHELLNTATKYPLGTVSAASHLEGFFSIPPASVLAPGKPRVTRSVSPARQVLRAEYESGAVSWLEVTLWSGMHRMDVALHVEGARLPDPGEDRRDSYFVSFPFGVPSKGAHLGYESPGGFLMPSAPGGRLPGAGTGIFVPQGTFDLRGDDGWGVHFASVECGPISLGGVGRSLVLDGSRESTFFVPIGRRPDGETGYGYDVDGLILAGTPPELGPALPHEQTLRFSISSNASRLDVTEATRFGRQLHLPLYGRDVAPNPRGFLPATSQAFFTVEPDNVALEVLKRPELGNRADVLVRVQEIAGRPAERVTLKSVFKIRDASLVQIDERPGEKKLQSRAPVQFSLKPGEFATVRLQLEPWTTKSAPEGELTVETVGPMAL
jgi:hypothetical protein